MLGFLSEYIHEPVVIEQWLKEDHLKISEPKRTPTGTWKCRKRWWA